MERDLEGDCRDMTSKEGLSSLVVHSKLVNN